MGLGRIRKYCRIPRRQLGRAKKAIRARDAFVRRFQLLGGERVRQSDLRLAAIRASL